MKFHHLMWHFSLEAQINIAHSRYLLESQSIGHPFGFTNTRLLEGKRVPIIPVIFNASYPPNVPTPQRCRALGQQLGRLIASFPAPLRVGVMASGHAPGLAANGEILSPCMAKPRKLCHNRGLPL